MLTDSQLLELALQPFRVLEELAIPAAYERSVKFERGLLTTQRYLLGASIRAVGKEKLMEAAGSLRPPKQLLDCFRQSLYGASAVLFGFEGGNHGAVFKLYAEYQHQPRAEFPVAHFDAFSGFKWDPVTGADIAETVYRYEGAVEANDLASRIDGFLGELNLNELCAPASELAHRVKQAGVSFDPFWLNIGELRAPVRAFDVNLYPTGLTVADVQDALRSVGEIFGIPRESIENLLSVAGPCKLGHLSAGASRRRQGFITIYFEPVDQNLRFN